MQDVAIVSLRFRFRAVQIAGHQAGCAVAWGIGHCSCAGRHAVVGRNQAKLLEEREAAAWHALITNDPNAYSWRDSHGLSKNS